jgi:uncharacterized protein
MIFETIISTQDASGNVHITPFGIREQDGYVIISPFKPSTTLTNILSTQCAVVNMTDDVRVFAGAIVKRQQFEVVPANTIECHRLANTLSHQELTLFKVVDDELRPQLWMKVVHSGLHASFKGFNRAQAAVVELAVLVSRLHLLPKEKIEQERAYLQIAMDKTAGVHEWEAWTWLIEKIDNFYAEQSGQNQA